MTDKIKSQFEEDFKLLSSKDQELVMKRIKKKGERVNYADIFTGKEQDRIKTKRANTKIKAEISTNTKKLTKKQQLLKKYGFDVMRNKDYVKMNKDGLISMNIHGLDEKTFVEMANKFLVKDNRQYTDHMMEIQKGIQMEDKGVEINGIKYMGNYLPSNQEIIDKILFYSNQQKK